MLVDAERDLTVTCGNLGSPVLPFLKWFKDEAETVWKVVPRGVSLIGAKCIGKQGSDLKALEGMRMLNLPPI